MNFMYRPICLQKPIYAKILKANCDFNFSQLGDTHIRRRYTVSSSVIGPGEKTM